MTQSSTAAEFVIRHRHAQFATHRLIVAFAVQHLFSLDRLWWIFNGVAACFVVPTVLSLYYARLSAKGVIAGICGAGIGMVGFVYGNWVQNDTVTVVSALFIVGISLFCCLVFRERDVWVPESAAVAGPR